MIQEVLVQQIQEGDLLPGERIMSERSLAEKFGVSRMAVQYALNALENKGVVERHRGSGTFVVKYAPNKINLGEFSSEKNLGITASFHRSGVKISNKVITRGFVTNRFLSYKLGIEREKAVYALHRVRYGNDEPFVIEYSYLPGELFPDINEVDFTDVSLYDYMESYGLMSVAFNESLQITEVHPREAGYLEISEGEPVYYTRLIGFSNGGKIVEYTESYTRCDKVEIKFKTSV